MADLRLNFRLLLRWDERHEKWAARCLETGHVAAADTQHVAEDMLCELLADEMRLARDRGNWRDLFSSPAQHEHWQTWIAAERGPIVCTVKQWPFDYTILRIPKDRD